MKTRKYGDLMFRRNINEAVREPTQYGASNLAFDDLILIRITPDCGYCCIDSSHKIGAETLAAGFVPIDGFRKFRFGLRP